LTDRAPDIIFNPISPITFEQCAFPCSTGREFSSADVHGASPAVILNEAAPHSLFPGKNAIGLRVQTWGRQSGRVVDHRCVVAR